MLDSKVSVIFYETYYGSADVAMEQKRLNKARIYIYDLSHIFDGKDDIYMDMCRVWKKGNEIIAEEIIKVILQEIEKGTELV